jgi:hypothetical protein
MGVEEYWRDVQKSPWHDTNFDGNVQVLQKKSRKKIATMTKTLM